jgi:hypothetical protein
MRDYETREINTDFHASDALRIAIPFSEPLKFSLYKQKRRSRRVVTTKLLSHLRECVCRRDFFSAVGKGLCLCIYAKTTNTKRNK